MAWYNFFLPKENITEEPTISTRSVEIDVPEKVFVGLDGPPPLGYEYSEQIPPHLDRLFSGYYACQNYLTLFKCLPELFSAVNFIAKSVADCTFLLCKEWNDEIDYKDPDFNRLFGQPNPLQTIRDLIYEAVCYEILTGKNFFYFNSNNLLAALDSKPKRTLTWSNLAASHVLIDVNKNIDPYTATSLKDFVGGYSIPTADGKRRYFPVDNVYPILHRDLEKPFALNNTIPLIKGADKAIQNLIPVYEARGTIYIRRGPLGFFVSEKKDESGTKAITPGEKKEAEDEMNKENGVIGGRNLFRAVKAPIRFEKVGADIKDMMPFDETAADAIVIYACLGIPRHHVPTKDHSTFANAEADDKRYYSSVAIPWARRYADVFTTALDYRAQRRYIRPDFSHIDVLQENKKEKADLDKTNNTTYQLQWLNGVISLNEWIIAAGGEKVSLPFYDKRIGELTPEELDKVKSFINLKSMSNATASQNTGTEAQGSTNPVQ